MRQDSAGLRKILNDLVSESTESKLKQQRKNAVSQDLLIISTIDFLSVPCLPETVPDDISQYCNGNQPFSAWRSLNGHAYLNKPAAFSGRFS